MLQSILEVVIPLLNQASIFTMNYFSEKRIKESRLEFIDKGMPALIWGVREKLKNFAQGAMQSDDIKRYRG